MLVKLASFGFLLMISALFFGMTSTQAQAYLDPGTGSMILQVLLGGVAGLALAGRLYWQRFREFIGLSPAGDDPAGDKSKQRDGK